MPALYIHIPFCKKACHYCSFYFTLSPVKKKQFIEALCTEIRNRKEELNGKQINTIYFGGGTPSILSVAEIEEILSTINASYAINCDAEISMESNPENLTEKYIQAIKQVGINRLSIGVQSFSDQDLKIMNRNHNAIQAMDSIRLAQKYFDNISLDFIFGLPYSGISQWQENLKQAIQLGIPHISTYNLTVEEKTALARKVNRAELPIESDESMNEMYFYTLDYLESKGLIPYEISNFGRQNYWSQHNIAYWTQEPYLGFGPSAHSFSESERRWNVSNLKNYIEGIAECKSYWEKETLTVENMFNEYLMTRWRTIFGIDIREIRTTFGEYFENHFLKKMKEMQNQNWILYEDHIYRLSKNGKVWADHIASECML